VVVAVFVKKFHSHIFSDILRPRAPPLRLVFFESFDACLFLITNFIYPAYSLILEKVIAFYTVLALELFEKRPIIEGLKVVIHSEAVQMKHSIDQGSMYNPGILSVAVIPKRKNTFKRHG